MPGGMTFRSLFEDMWSFWYETDDGGAVIGAVEGDSLDEVRALILQTHPGSAGADGELTSPEGEELPLW